MAFLAADPLIAANIDLQRLSTACPGLDPFTVEVRPAPWILRRIVPNNIAAVALPWAIYVEREQLASGDIGPLILHELVHVRQWQRLGTWRFLKIYLSDYLRNRRSGMDHDHAYLAIRLEKEARVAVARHLAKG